MKTIGLLGGMSWESSLAYYRLVNEGIKEKLGGLHSAKCLLLSVDFAEIEVLQQQARWDEAGEYLASAARSLEAGGAECVVLCTNTMHKVADEMQAGIGIPLLHIADATAQAIKAAGLKKIGLLGTRFTMDEDFYRGRLTDMHGLTVLLPSEDERDVVHRVIYDELVLGEIKNKSRQEYARIMKNLVNAGAQGIILGCTEIGLLVKPEDSDVPLFDTTRLHAQAAVEFALEAD